MSEASRDPIRKNLHSLPPSISSSPCRVVCRTRFDVCLLSIQPLLHHRPRCLIRCVRGFSLLEVYTSFSNKFPANSPQVTSRLKGGRPRSARWKVQSVENKVRNEDRTRMERSDRVTSGNSCNPLPIERETWSSFADRFSFPRLGARTNANSGNSSSEHLG